VKLLPPPLFKYTKRIHALSLVNQGKVRIGTLHDFQKIEQYAPMIGDKAEGEKRRYDNPVFASAGGLSRFARPIADSVFANLPTDPAERFLFLQCSFEKIDRSPNRRLYSTSTRLGASTMHAMDPAYDTCVRIDYVFAFFHAIEQELIRLNLATHGLIRPVRYRERTQHYLKDNGLDPVLLKPLSHVDQHEVRFIFFPAKEITEGHRILTIPKLRDFCEIDPRVDSIK
jgi:hypothetical protein